MVNKASWINKKIHTFLQRHASEATAYTVRSSYDQNQSGNLSIGSQRLQRPKQFNMLQVWQGT